MRTLLLLIALVAVEGRSTKTCKVSDWSPWTQRGTPFNEHGVRSFPSPQVEGATDKGEEGRSYMMDVKMALGRERAQCKADGTCPTLTKMNDEGAFPCVGGLINGNLPCSNIDQQSFVPLSTLAQGGSIGDGNDIWGWTDPETGDEYAIMGYYYGTAFVRVTDAQNPVTLGRLDSHGGRGSSWRDMKVVNNHAYIVSEATGHGVQVFDLTQLRGLNTYTVFEETSHYDALSNCHNIISNEDTEFVYAVGCTRGFNGCSGGLHALDVSDPANPQFAGCYGGDGYVHDAQCVVYNGPDSLYFGREVCFCYNEDTFTIVDATVKNDMQLLSRTGYGNARYTHQGWVTEDHTLVLLDDELDEQQIDGTQRTYLWDVSDLDNPSLVSTYNSGINSIDHNQYIIGDLTYQANYESGLRILSIDQAAPSLTEVAYFDVFPSRDTDQFFGSWSVYPYFSSGNVIISSIDYGLYVVRPDMAAIREAAKTPVSERRRYREILQADSIDDCPNLVEVESL